MRSSKSRSRSKPNRPRTLGNIINRVFDSSGPEGKVRGTPAQLIEKYQFLARDAQLSNDRVATENFLQHAEHYTRLLAEAMREMAAEQESRQQYQQQNNQNGNQNGNQNAGQGGQNPQRDRPQVEREPRNDRRDDRSDYRPEFRSEYRDEAANEQPVVTAHDLVDHVRYEDAGLVETPEAAPRPARQEEPRRNDRPRYDRPRDEQRRPYPPRVDQQQHAERQDKPALVKVAEPAHLSVAADPTPVPEAAPAAKPRSPSTRTRAPKKPVETVVPTDTGPDEAQG